MKLCDLIAYLECFDNNDELTIAIFETTSGKQIDITSDITFEANNGLPTLKIDIEAAKIIE